MAKFSYELALYNDGKPTHCPIIFRMKNRLTDVEASISKDDAQALLNLMAQAIKKVTEAEKQSTYHILDLV